MKTFYDVRWQTNWEFGEQETGFIACFTSIEDADTLVQMLESVLHNSKSLPSEHTEVMNSRNVSYHVCKRVCYESIQEHLTHELR
jgi:hypothetical protein